MSLARENAKTHDRAKIWHKIGHKILGIRPETTLSVVHRQ
jgi:hypothetical protein